MQYNYVLGLVYIHNKREMRQLARMIVTRPST